MTEQTLVEAVAMAIADSKLFDGDKLRNWIDCIDDAVEIAKPCAQSAIDAIHAHYVSMAGDKRVVQAVDNFEEANPDCLWPEILTAALEKMKELA